jgi:hypothetical protein
MEVYLYFVNMVLRHWASKAGRETKQVILCFGIKNCHSSGKGSETCQFYESIAAGWCSHVQEVDITNQNWIICFLSFSSASPGEYW